MIKKLFSFIVIGVISLLAFSLTKADYLDSSFWASNPTDNQIETALFALDSSYTENRTGYSSACSISSVIHVSEGTNVLPATLAANTIYILDEGTYTTTHQIDLADCTAVVGSGDVVLQSTGQLTATLFGSGNQNIILDNIKIDGATQHDTLKNTYGLWIQGASRNISLNNIESYRQGSIGAYFKQSSYINIYNSVFFENVSIGLYFETVTQSIINNSEAYQNNGTSTNVHGGFILNGSSYILLKNIVSHDNYRMNISLYSSTYCTVDNAKLYNSPYRSLFISYGGNHTITNSYTYNNSVGLYFYKTSKNILNNTNVFNNSYGLQGGTYTSVGIAHNAINNVNFFNNTEGVHIWGDNYDLFNNVSFFNNGVGLFVEDLFNNNFFNKISFYSNNIGLNFDYGRNISTPSENNKYYGDFLMFENDSNFSGYSIRAGYTDKILYTSINSGFIVSGYSTGLGIIYPTAIDGKFLFIGGNSDLDPMLGFSSGLFNGENTMSDEWQINVLNESGISLFSGLLNNKGRNLTWIPSENLTFIYGKSISKQIQPIYYDGSSYSSSDLDWNYAVYVGKTWDSDFYFIDKEYITGTEISSFVTDTNTFVGEDSLDVGLFVDSSFPKDVVLQSTGTTKIETFIDSGVYFKQANGTTNYIGTLSAPVELNKNTASELKGQYINSVVHIGSSTDTIRFKDGSGNDTSVTVRIPIPGLSIGTPITIFYSSDEVNWNTLTTSNIIDVSGTSYAEFNTTHFTYFAVSGGTGSFVINNDDATTSTSGVTLAIDASGAQYMRFSNDGSNRSTWESYTTSKSWDLSDIPGTKTVYAQFDIDGDFTGDISTFDTIFLLDIQQGQLSLEILTGSSECVYGTSLYLGEQDVKLNSGYTFTGSFSGQRYCADYVGISSGWVFTIGVSDLDNGNGGIISGSNLSISHGGAITQGDSACTGYDGAASEFYTTPYTLIEKAIDSNKICKVTLDSVDIEINVPANQAPGSYAGTLTIYVPNF